MRTAAVQGRVYNYAFAFGSQFDGGRGVLRPVDFGMGPSGALYIVSRGIEYTPSQGLLKANLDSTTVWQYRGSDFGDGRCPCPSSIAIDSQENLYVADEYTNHIFIYDKDGEYKGHWDHSISMDGDPDHKLIPIPNTVGGLPFDHYLRMIDPERGRGQGELNGPSGLAFDGDDNLHIVDSRNSRVQVFTKEGGFIRMWGAPGSGEGEFNMPWGLTVDKDGFVYVADWKNHRVQKFSFEGEYVMSFGTPGEEEGELRLPTDVAIDQDGDVYVTDWGNEKLNIYTPEGEFLHSFYGDAKELADVVYDRLSVSPDHMKARLRATDPSVEWKLWKPSAVNVDQEGRIIICETRTSRFQVYRKEKGWADPQFNL